MSSKKFRLQYACAECGYRAGKWMGRCPECGAWNSFTEVVAMPRVGPGAVAVEMASLEGEEEPRLPLGMGEVDRVLGGGLVVGSVVLIGGDPGVGKSTLLLQAAASVAARGLPALYVSGEESARQVKMRAQRLGVAGRGLFILAETQLEAALAQAEAVRPSLVVVDSIQTIYSQEVPQAPGSVIQVRHCTLELMRWAKVHGIPVIIVGHVTKEGEIAGPKLVEHVVDVVLYMEGERYSSYRLLRGVKNRFGSVAEVGVLEMRDEGLVEVENPSALFLSGRAPDGVGSAVVATMEGTRPLLVEIQALTSPSFAPVPRRTGNGVDPGRLIVVTAVLSRRLGFPLGKQDIIVSAVGGLKVTEPAADLAMALAIASSYRDRPLPGDLVVMAEVGLSGELRYVPHLERRLAEAQRLGFTKAIVPKSSIRRGMPQAIEVLPAATLREAISWALAKA